MVALSFKDDILGIAQGGGTLDAGAFNPAAVDLSSDRAHDPYTQTGAISFALAAVSEVSGVSASVLVTGNGAAITYSSDFAAVDGGALTAAPYNGFSGPRRLILMWDEPTGKALVALSGAAGGGVTDHGALTGLSDNDHPQYALANNPNFTGTLTLPSGAIETADIADDAVTFAKMQGASAASRLVGRGSSGLGDFQEITLGANLSITGTTLAASGTVAPSADASTTTYTPGWTGAILTNLKEALDNGQILSKYFGLNGNGVFNNTTNLNTAMDAVLTAGGGELKFATGSYVISNITLREKVTLVGVYGGSTPQSGARLDAIAGTVGVLLQGPASGAGYGLKGLVIGGGSSLASGTSLTAVQYSGSGSGYVERCYISNFTGHGIRFTNGFQYALQVSVNNGFYNAYSATPDIPAVKSGCIHLEGGSDHAVTWCGASSRSTGKVSSADLRVCAVLVKSNGCWLNGGDYHHCDVGLHIGDGAFRTNVFGVRCDANAGHGVEIPLSSADHTLCVGLMVQRVGGIIDVPGGYDSTNLYDGLSIQDPSHHIFDGCRFHGRLDGAVTPQMRWGVNDTSGSSSSNQYVNCAVDNPVTGKINAPPSALVISDGVLRQVEEAVAGAYTVVPTDLGKIKRHTGGVSVNWGVNNLGSGGRVTVENPGAGTITFTGGTATLLGSNNTCGPNAAVDIVLVNGGANYRVSAI